LFNTFTSQIRRYIFENRPRNWVAFGSKEKTNFSDTSLEQFYKSQLFSKIVPSDYDPYPEKFLTHPLFNLPFSKAHEK